MATADLVRCDICRAAIPDGVKAVLLVTDPPKFAHPSCAFHQRPAYEVGVKPKTFTVPDQLRIIGRDQELARDDDFLNTLADQIESSEFWPRPIPVSERLPEPFIKPTPPNLPAYIEPTYLILCGGILWDVATYGPDGWALVREHRPIRDQAGVWAWLPMPPTAELILWWKVQRQRVLNRPVPETTAPRH